MYEPPSPELLTKILVDARTIAMVGASSNPDRASHRIMKQLLAAGYHVIPVNPKETEVLGQRAYASLRELTEPVDIVDVFRRSEDTPDIADDAIAIKAKALWLQLGVTSDEAAKRATAGGLTIVMDTCLGAAHHSLAIPPRRA
ncbi:MAG: CoA-binding protein [Kofleriaceae bacterium]